MSYKRIQNDQKKKKNQENITKPKGKIQQRYENQKEELNRNSGAE